MKGMMSAALVLAAFTAAVLAGSPQNAALAASRTSGGTARIAAGNPAVGKRRAGRAGSGGHRQADDHRVSRAARKLGHGDHRRSRRRLRRAGDRTRRTSVGYWYNAMGITAFVLKYRLGPRYHHPIELGDAQRAIRTVRARAAEFNIVPDRIGMMGFSAGGHLDIDGRHPLRCGQAGRARSDRTRRAAGLIS